MLLSPISVHWVVLTGRHDTGPMHLKGQRRYVFTHDRGSLAKYLLFPLTRTVLEEVLLQ